MTAATRISVLAVVLLLAVVAIAAQFVPVRHTGERIPIYTTNSGELVAGDVVGQNFVAEEDKLSGLSVMFATYANRDNQGTVELHLRDDITSTQDVRTASVAASSLRDNQFHEFRFEPIVGSRDQTYYFFLTAPEGQPEQAVTVDLNTQDPYHRGTAFLVRETPGALNNPDLLQRSGKQTIDVVFATHYTVPLRVAVVSYLTDAARTFVVTWDDQRGNYILWLELAIPAVLFIVFFVGLQRRVGSLKILTPRVVATTLIILGIIAIALRLFYAAQLPVTNDEGNYLYDAASLRRGVLAGGDGYVKAPLVIGWIALWQILFGNSILAGRLAPILIGALTIVPIYVLGAVSMHRRAGLVAAAAWALFGVTAVFNIYVHTQSLAIFFGTSGLAVLWLALRQRDGAVSGRGVFMALGAGALLGLGVTARKSVLALGLVPLTLIAIEAHTWRQRITYLLAVGIGFAAVVGLFLGGATAVYGPEGFWEALGANSAEDGINAVDPAEADQVLAYSLRGMTPFFRESLPFLLVSLLGWGIVLETTTRRIIRKLLKQQPPRQQLIILDHMAPKIAWLAPAAAFAWAWQFFWEYEGGIFLTIGEMPWLWTAIAVALAVAAMWPRAQHERFVFKEDPIVQHSQQPVNTIQRPSEKQSKLTITIVPTIRQYLAASIVPLAWIGGLVVFYINWIKFHANYIGEFLPPLAVLAGVGAYGAWHRLRSNREFTARHPLLTIGRRTIAALFLLILFWALYISNYITYVFEHTGTFQQDSLKEAAAWARQNIPFSEDIFTGAAAVPYLSGHRTALDIAHPRWYAYEFTRKDPERLNTFLPPAEEMVEAFRASEWILLERQTGFSFLMEYTEIERSIETDFDEVHTIENGSNTLRFLRRRQPTAAPG